MDIRKLFDRVIEDDGIKDIPLMYVLQVFYTILNVMNTGECFYKEEID